jgi:hypothetical protein
MTWNESEESLRDTINTFSTQHPHIQMTISVDETINYLDTEISDIDGTLKTKVAKDIDTEPHSLPFVFGHRRNKYKTLLRAALIRATRSCAHVSDFVNEFEGIQISFHHNRFSNDFIVDKVLYHSLKNSKYPI